jgi:hypothetical protein
MAKYNISNLHAGTQQNLSTSYKTLVSLTAATGATTLRRAWVYELAIGADGTPADNQITFCVDRQTDVGTGTAAVATPLDVGDAAALITETVNNTIEPTVTSASFVMGPLSINQRASYRWVAAPGCELVVPAVDTDGLGLRAKSAAYASTTTGSLLFWE